MQLSPTDKSAARAHFLGLRKTISEEQRTSLGRDICDNLYLQIKRLAAKTVLLYHPVRGEVDVLPLAEALLNDDIAVAFPVSHTEDIRLEFRTVHSLSQMSVGAYGICEPDECSVAVTDFSDCVCVVPALSVDTSGVRLGYGKGYYDRFLADRHVFSICPLYSDFLCDSLPSDKNDFKIQAICTEKGVIFVEQ